ncbi:MAG: cysteine--tRNA ligase [Candidatus Diapherotrites archaeon]|nr:cysteine--tRNA ligase [Candidatus Diapherotrites archaeon]
MSDLFLYNTLSKKKEKFVPLKKGKVGMYSCGPTVYGSPHIGNYFAFFAADLLKRYLNFKEFEVKHVMNLTDIDDKTIRDSDLAGLTLREFTDKNAEDFFWGLKVLNIVPAGKYPRATEHIPEMIALIEKLIKNKHAYVKGGDVYFDINSFKPYGKLSGVDLSQLEAGARVDVDEYDKDNPADFALWKESSSEEIARQIFYESPWGKGRPGWHIECSAMSSKYLGESFDVHTGGIDLRFPHHENEIAQSEGASGKPFVKYWVHNGHVMVESEKMSKSKGNFLTLRDLVDKGVNPRAIRFVFFSSHYRSPINITERSLKDATTTLDRLHDFYLRLQKPAPSKEINKELHVAIRAQVKAFEDAMDDDLNTSNALAVFFELVSLVNKALDAGNVNQENLDEVLGVYNALNSVFGFLTFMKSAVPKEIHEWVLAREKARKAKDFKTADELRDKIAELGWVVADTPQGPVLKKKL